MCGAVISCGTTSGIFSSIVICGASRWIVLVSITICGASFLAALVAAFDGAGCCNKCHNSEDFPFPEDFLEVSTF